MDLNRRTVSNEPVSEEVSLGLDEGRETETPKRARHRQARASATAPIGASKTSADPAVRNGQDVDVARRARSRKPAGEDSLPSSDEVLAELNSDTEEQSQSSSADELIERALVPNDPGEMPLGPEPAEQWGLRGSAQAFAFDRQMRAYADDLKHVLATLAKGHSVKRSTQRIVVAGVNTEFDASRVAWGLALTSAGSGFRVLLVDANLHRPAAHAQFGVSNDFGLTDLLFGSEAPHRFPQSTPVPNLAVITAGPKLSVYAGLLSREQLFHRLQPLAKYFDYIIVDAARLTPALVGRVSEGADNVIVTAKQHASSMRELATLVRTLRDAGAPEASVLMLE